MQIHDTATISCSLAGDLVNSVQLGQIVDISGVASINDALIQTRRLLFTIDANYINPLKNTKSGFVGSFITSSDFSLIQSISSNQFLFPLLVNSIRIRANLLVKAVLLLLLLSTSDDPLHVLISRKLDDLSNFCDLAPHCIRFDEGTTQKLIASRKKNWFQAGAFAQANDGLLVIDDIDRFISSQFVFLEIIETSRQQIDSFHCLPVVFSSLVVGSSPKVDAEKFTVCLQIEENKKPLKRVTPKLVQRGFEHWANMYLPIGDRLSGGGETVEAADLFRYVTYARQFVYPKWTDGARRRLREVSKTSVQMRRIKNLAQCRARCDLREEVIESDVEEVGEILMSCGCYDRKPTKERVSSRQKVLNEFMIEFKRLASYKQDGKVGLDEMKEIAEIVQVGSKFSSFDQFLDTLSTNNFVLQSGPRKYSCGPSSRD
jgi:DNA replicative helicase MCM subunit Mcm2 (Cdc46/Mcm family)